MTRLALPATLTACLTLAALPIEAASFVLPSDRELARQAEWVVEGSIRGWEMAAEGAMPVTRYHLEVERILQGDGLPGVVTVRVAGGYTQDGTGLELSGAPRFGRGEGVLLFLVSRSDGTFGVLHLALGAFHRVRGPAGQELALRDLSGGRLLGLDGTAAAEDPVRD